MSVRIVHSMSPVLVGASLRIACPCQSSDCVKPISSVHEWRDLASPLRTVSQARLWPYTAAISLEWRLEKCVCLFVFNRRLILVLVWVLTIIKWEASRHNAGMY